MQAFSKHIGVDTNYTDCIFDIKHLFEMIFCLGNYTFRMILGMTDDL